MQKQPKAVNRRAISWSLLPLLALAGATDALMIMHSKELLGVYMTGNSSKLAGYVAQGLSAKAEAIGSVIVAFVFSTTLAAAVGDRLKQWRASVLLLCSGLLLMSAAPLASAAQPYSVATVWAVAAAMGALNQVCADEPGVTFVTGTLVKLGRSLAAGRPGPAADAFLRWSCFSLGALLGAIVEARLGAATLLVLGVGSVFGGLGSWTVQSRGAALKYRQGAAE